MPKMSKQPKGGQRQSPKGVIKPPPSPAPPRGPVPHPPDRNFISDGDRKDIEEEIVLMTKCGLTLRQIRATVDYLIDKGQYDGQGRD